MYSSAYDNFDPSVCISNKLRRLNRVIANVYRKYLSPFNITDSQLSILFILYKKGSLTQNSISKTLQLEKSSLNRNLRRLVERQLISKAEFPLIGLTDIGVDLVNTIIPAWKEAMKETEQLLKEDGVVAIDLLNKKIK